MRRSAALSPNPLVASQPLDRPYYERYNALRIFADVLEFCGPAAVAYAEDVFVPSMYTAIMDLRTEVRQAACYGFGVMAMHCGPAFEAVAIGALAPLVQMVQQARASGDAILLRDYFDSATDHAISAVAKICRSYPGAVPLLDILPTWLSWLPLTVDDDEGVFVYGYLCEMIEANHPTIVQRELMPHIVRVIAHVVGTPFVDAAITERMAAIVRDVEAFLGVDELGAVAAQLPEKEQHALAELMMQE